MGTNFYLTAAGVLPTSDPLVLKANNIQNILGIQSIDTGILGAVIVGIIVYRLHERFHTIRLPDALAFFGGTRFVPIVTTVVLGLCGTVIPLIWPWFAAGITGLGWVINSAGAFGPMLFGTGERLLLPFGLQHILVALIRFTEAGGTMEVCGHSVSGALTIFGRSSPAQPPPASPRAPPASCRRVKCRRSSAGCRAQRWRCITAPNLRTAIKSKGC